MRNIWFLTAVSSSLCASCEPRPGPTQITRDQAVALADQHLNKHFQHLGSEHGRPTANEIGKAWVITYLATPGRLRKTVTVIVAKETREVIAAYSED
jgi:hypothetical protein